MINPNFQNSDNSNIHVFVHIEKLWSAHFLEITNQGYRSNYFVIIPFTAIWFLAIIENM